MHLFFFTSVQFKKVLSSSMRVSLSLFVFEIRNTLPITPLLIYSPLVSRRLFINKTEVTYMNDIINKLSLDYVYPCIYENVNPYT